LRLLKLNEKVQEMVINGELSMGHARALLAIKDQEVQIQTAKRIVEEGLSVRKIEKIVKELSNKKEKKKEDDRYKYLYKDAEENLKQILGNKVSIKNKKNNKGKIEIEYYSQDDLERIIDLLQR
jgi:ParB family chromosome partitioning protein